MIFQIFQTFRLLFFGTLVLIHCMTHCIMQYIHISWPSLDFPCSSISARGWKLTCGVVWSRYGGNLSGLSTGTDRLEVHRSTRFWQPTSQISCIHPSCQPAHLHILSREGRIMKSFKQFSALCGIQSILVPFYLLGPRGGVSTAESENGKGQKSFQGVKDHFLVAVVSSDWAIMGSSGVQCGRRNALSLHSSILLHIV